MNEQTQSTLDAVAATPIEFLYAPGDQATRRHHYGDLGKLLPASNWLARSRVQTSEGRIGLLLIEVPKDSMPAAILKAKEQEPTRTAFPVAEFPGCLTGFSTGVNTPAGAGT